MADDLYAAKPIPERATYTSACSVWQACEKIVYGLKHCMEKYISVALSDVRLLFSHGLAACSQCCQISLGLINQVKSEVCASMLALACVPVQIRFLEKKIGV